MRLLLLTEGDAERYDSWSGTAKSVVDHLRLLGHEVLTRDVDVYGARKAVSAALSFSPNRKRWGVRHHLGPVGYALRSRLAVSAVDDCVGRIDAILQIGATFDARGTHRVPYVLFCDSNIQTSLEGAKHGVSDTAWLSHHEFERIRARESAVYRGASGVLTISEFLRRSFVDDFGIAADRVVTVGAGPNLDPGKVPAPTARAGTSAPTILFIGKQFERKGGRFLLDAFERVRRVMPDARLVIAGPTESPSSAPGVEYLGNLNKNTDEGWRRMADAYASADVFCLPSLFEPFGIVILEAMLFGVPCVGTREWAIPEMIDDGRTGYTVPRADAEQLAEALLRVLQASDRGRAMGLQGRARAIDHFSWPAVARRMEAAISHCLTQPAVGR